MGIVPQLAPRCISAMLSSLAVMYCCDRMRKVLFALCLAFPAYAGALDLYTGEVILEPGQGAHGGGLLRALDQVLGRLTGRVGENLTGALNIAERDLERLMLGYQFRQIEVPQADGGTLPQRRLRVEFDAGAVDRIVADAGLPSWGRERPEILMWIVIDDGDEVAFAADDPVIEFALTDAASRCGLSVLRPLGDAQDLTEVTVADVRGGFLESALPGAARYGADAVVMVELRAGSGFWTGRWKWKLIGAAEQGFERSAPGAPEALDAGLERIASSLAARFAVIRGNEAQRQLLAVSGVTAAVHYAELMAYLRNLSIVEDIELRSAGNDRVLFVLELSGAGLEEIISLGGTLEFQFREPDTGALEYRIAW